MAQVAVATVAFIATNIDDIVVLLLFYSQASVGFTSARVVVGQYVGLTALIAVSLLGFVGGLLVPREWIGLLGLVPIILGIRYWLARDGDDDDVPAARAGTRLGALSAVSTVAAVMFASGGDNIGIYVPLFAASTLSNLIITLIVFYFLMAVWCAGAYLLGRHPLVANGLTRHGHRIVPFVLIALGVYILVESGTHTLVLERG